MFVNTKKNKNNNYCICSQRTRRTQLLSLASKQDGVDDTFFPIFSTIWTFFFPLCMYHHTLYHHDKYHRTKYLCLYLMLISFCFGTLLRMCADAIVDTLCFLPHNVGFVLRLLTFVTQNSKFYDPAFLLKRIQATGTHP
ncbi:hypothetical protein BKA57DRAFT_478365 [Linnemannia elongata]|nr:hypothetical protein BKA57DRAFT_478365 [Linnemannia elongata]